MSSCMDGRLPPLFNRSIWQSTGRISKTTTQRHDSMQLTMLATLGFDISLSSPPLAIICCAICIIAGLFIMPAMSGMPPAPSPPMFPSESAKPPSPPALGSARGLEDALGGGAAPTTSVVWVWASEFRSPVFMVAFSGSNSRP